MVRSIAVVALVALSSSWGCHRGWEREVTQPKLELGTNEVLRTSYPVFLVMRDMSLPRFMYLPNTVYFHVVSKDRIRFHVTLYHKWDSFSDPGTWRVWLEDDLGRRFLPEGIDRRKVEPVTEMYFPHMIPGSSRNEAALRAPIYSYTVYRGDGDYVFYARDLYREDMTELKLVMQRRGYEYRWVWHFVDGDELEAELAAVDR